MHRTLAALTLLTAVAACGPAPASETEAGGAPPPAARAEEEIAGSYRRTEPSGGTLRIDAESDRFRVRIQAGGLPNGAATAADCVVQALGPREGDRVVATVVPFEDDPWSLSAEDIGADPPTITIELTPEGARVSDSGAAGRYCPLGSDLSGLYRPEG